MNWSALTSYIEYQNARKATDELGNPGGFIQTEKTPTKGTPDIIGQNNVQTYLLTSLHQKIDILLNKLEEEKQQSRETAEYNTQLNIVIERLAQLKLTDKNVPPVPIRKVYYFKDPAKILEDEQRNLGATTTTTGTPTVLDQGLQAPSTSSA